MIEVFIANESFLIREGLKVLLNSEKEIKIVGEASGFEELKEKAIACQPDVLIIDHSGEKLSLDSIGFTGSMLPKTHLLGITQLQPKQIMLRAIEAGVKSHVLDVCSAKEIKEAVYATAKGEKFFCGTIVEAMIDANEETLEEGIPATSCDPVKVSGRELEIIKNIAQGYTNKEIADRLFISTHTVMTHRKNIMSKLGINNTAGLVMYAVKENLVEPNQYQFESTIK